MENSLYIFIFCNEYMPSGESIKIEIKIQKSYKHIVGVIYLDHEKKKLIHSSLYFYYIKFLKKSSVFEYFKRVHFIYSFGLIFQIYRKLEGIVQISTSVPSSEFTNFLQPHLMSVCLSLYYYYYFSFSGNIWKLQTSWNSASKYFQKPRYSLHECHTVTPKKFSIDKIILSDQHLIFKSLISKYFPLELFGYFFPPRSHQGSHFALSCYVFF